MSKKMIWQDWALLAGILVILALASIGCQAAEPTLAPPRVLIFHAEWCPHCPSDQDITRLMVEFPYVEVCPVDVDRDPETARKYRVRKLPTMILCDSLGCRVTNNFEELRCWLVEHASL